MRSASTWITKYVTLALSCAGIYLVASVILSQTRGMLTMTRKEAKSDDVSRLREMNPLLLRENKSHQDVIKERKTHVTEMCKTKNYSFTETDARRKFLIDEKSRLSMCYVPTVGGHIGTLKRLKPFDSANKFLSQSTKMIFVRDPYSRLYSTYLEKFFVGEFSGSWGRAIVKAVRAKPKDKSEPCGHDVTFGEFIEYVTRIFNSSKPEISGGEEYWMPISTLCHPCHFDYDIIGKQETFPKDRSHIFELFKIFLNSPTVLVMAAFKQSMNSIWDKQLPCFSRKEYTRRLWMSFQNQGFIHKSLEFPVEKVPDNIKKAKFLKLAMDAYKQIPMLEADRKNQRKQAMETAYSFVSYKTLFKVAGTFHLDFELFQYEVEPKELFPYVEDT